MVRDGMTDSLRKDGLEQWTISGVGVSRFRLVRNIREGRL